MKIFQKGDKVKINFWHYDRRLPFPSYGRIEIGKPQAAGLYYIKLDQDFKGQSDWWFKLEEFEVIGNIENENGCIPDKIKTEMLEILAADKPAEHILADIEDYLTN